ncbi:MAG: ABC transporter ATP-binding protein, partial [Rhodospirillales bacterium]|nr:ABC transporter ATP-binding protein [Rhodospirillales bacterium]
MVDIVIDNVTKKFGDFTAVDDLEIVFEHGQVSCLLGPSGCGKTTLMRMVAGLETLTSGRVLFGDKDVSHWPARKREVGMVFQYPVMYPTLSVQENISIPLKHDRSLSSSEIDKRVAEVLEILDLSDRARAFIEDLNAGDRQKVAVGRAVIRRSEVILFDEPTTNVEVKAKLQLIRAFKEVSRRFKQTTVYVTHD